jgi:hypothetical protein
MADAPVRPRIHLAGEIAPALLDELRALAEVAPYDGGDGPEVVLLDGEGGSPLLADAAWLARVLGAGAQLAVVHPREEQAALLRRAAGVAVSADEVDLVAYLRLPGSDPAARSSCHLHAVPRRRQSPGAAGARPFGAADVVEALGKQRARVEALSASPVPGMFPPHNRQAWGGFIPLSIQPAFGTWQFPTNAGTSATQTWQISLECDLYWLYVNGDPQRSPYYLVVVMMYPSFLTGASSGWTAAGPPGAGFTPYVLQAAGAALRNWSAGFGGSTLSLDAFPSSISLGEATRPTAPGQPQPVTAALLGSSPGVGISLPLYSSVHGSWTVPPWTLSTARQVMNLTADLGLTMHGTGWDQGETGFGWLFQTEWLYHRVARSDGPSFVAGTFVAPTGGPTTPPLEPLTGAPAHAPSLANWTQFFTAPNATLATGHPSFGPATLEGLGPAYNPTLYGLAVIGPNLAPPRGGWTDPGQYLPPPPADLSFQPQLSELLTCLGQTQAAGGWWYWTAPAVARSFPRVSVTLPPPQPAPLP